MTRKGQLTVIGTQWDETGEEQRTQTTASAEYYTANGSLYLLYEEISAEDKEITKNMIKLKGSMLELTKRGAVNARMVFEPKQEYMTLYSTPFGSLPLGILTDTLESVLSEKEILISATYSLTCQDLSGQDPTSQRNVISHCKIFIQMVFQD